MRKKLYNFIQVFVLLLSFAMMAQVKNTGTKISDKIAEAPTELKSNSILELESKHKGFLLPRMSTAERNQIDVSTQTNTDTGLAIFNTTNDCIEYYSAITKKWVSLCGTPPPSVIDLENLSCDKLEINIPMNVGGLQAGVPLTGKDIQITLPIRIHEPGTYQIDMYSRKDGQNNGYYFSTTGTFMSEGTQDITITGQGTPKDGYYDANEGDDLVVSLNGKEVLTCSKKQFVKKADTNYKVVADEYYVGGKVYLGVNTSSVENTVTIKVDVQSLGRYVIESIGSTNGIKLTGSGEFTQLGVQEVVLRASGIPTSRGTESKGFDVPIKTNSGLAESVPPGTKIYVKVEPTKLIPNCADIKVIGEYVQGSDIKASSNYLTVPVEVKSPGRAVIELVSEDDGFVFKSEEMDFNFNAVTNNIVEVILKPESKVIPFGKASSSFKFKKTNDLDLSNCTTDFVLNFDKPAVDYEIVDCKDIKPQKRNFPGRKDITDDRFDIKVKVLVKIAGPYTITATTINGPSFTATGVFDLADQGKSVTVSLKANGQFDVDTKKSTQFIYTISASATTTKTCTFNVTAGLPDISILRLTDSSGMKNILPRLMIERNFGLDGLFAQVASLTYKEIGYSTYVNHPELKKPAKQRAEEIKQYILDNEVNIVLVDYTSTIAIGDSGQIFDTFYAPEADGSFPILKVLVELAKERKIALGYFFAGPSISPTAQTLPLNSKRLTEMAQYFTDIIYPELPKSEVPQFFYPGTYYVKSQNYNCTANIIYKIPSSLKGKSHYLTPDYLDKANSKLTDAQIAMYSVFDKHISTPTARLTYNNITSPKFIPLTDKIIWKGSPKNAEGYVFYTVEDYAIVVGAFSNLDYYYIAPDGYPRTTTIYDYNCDSRQGAEYVENNGNLVLSLITGLIQDVKNGL